MTTGLSKQSVLEFGRPSTPGFPTVSSFQEGDQKQNKKGKLLQNRSDTCMTTTAQMVIHKDSV